MHRVVIVGCGFAGLFATRALRRAPVDVVVVDRTNHHLFQPLLYQVATGVLSEGDIAPPIRDVLRHQRNARVVLGEAVEVDVEDRQLTIDTLGKKVALPYDSLIVATGASSSYFGHDEYARHAPGMKTIDDALELRGRVFGAFEIAELEPDDATRERWLTFAIVGAGPTGVELAGQIAELSRRALRGNFRRFDPRGARIVLVDAVDSVLPVYPDRLRRRARRDLERLGVEVRLGTRVVGVDERGLDVVAGDGDPGRIEARTKIWAAGVQASPLGRMFAERAGATADRAGRVSVNADCSVPGHPEIFVVGDLMALNDLPGLAEVAMQSGHHAARTIVRRLGGRSSKPFRYVDLGTMATIARFRAVATVGRLQIAGFVGWMLWLVVHLGFLTGFKNRISAVANWAVAFLGRGTPAHHHQAAGLRPHARAGDPEWEARDDDAAGEEWRMSTEADAPTQQNQREQTKLALASLLVLLFFVIGFATCIIGTYHAPHPNGIKLAVVGPPAQTAPVRAGLAKAAGSAFVISQVQTVAEATRDVRKRDLDAAFVPTANPRQPATVIVAEAGGRLVATAAETLAQNLTAAQRNQLIVRDVRPLPAGDEIGLGVFLFIIVCTICGYLAVSLLYTAAPDLLPSRLYPMIAAIAALVPTIAYLIGGLGWGTYTGSFGTIVAFICVGALYAFVIGLITRLFQVRIGPLALFVSLAIFVFLNIPSLGATYTAQLLPPFWRFLNHFWIGAESVNAERSILYFGGQGVGPDILRLLAWTAAIIALLLLAVAWKRSRAREPSVSGALQPTAPRLVEEP